MTTTPNPLSAHEDRLLAQLAQDWLAFEDAQGPSPSPDTDADREARRHEFNRRRDEIDEALRPLVEIERLRRRVQQRADGSELTTDANALRFELYGAHNDAMLSFDLGDDPNEGDALHVLARVLVGGVWIEGYVAEVDARALYLRREDAHTNTSIPFSRIDALEAVPAVNTAVVTPHQAVAARRPVTLGDLTRTRTERPMTPQFAPRPDSIQAKPFADEVFADEVIVFEDVEGGLHLTALLDGCVVGAATDLDQVGGGQMEDDMRSALVEDVTQWFYGIKTSPTEFHQELMAATQANPARAQIIAKLVDGELTIYPDAMGLAGKHYAAE